MSVTLARRVALDVLAEVDRGRRLDLAWESAAPALSAADRAWTHELLYGCVRLRGRLDHLLDLHLHRGIGSVPLPILQVLRLGAYQLVRMGSVPAYAAVSQCVDQARERGGAKAAGAVNGVLRALADAGGGEERFPSFDVDPVAHLATWGSHPRWLVERWVERWGAARARSLVEAGNRIPAVYLRPIGESPERSIEELARAGVTAAEGPSGTVELGAGSDPTAALAATRGIVQDPAASRVVEHAAALDGAAPEAARSLAHGAAPASVVDVCAAPGGKGIALAGLGFRVFAMDLSRPRLVKMRSALRRLGLRERLVVADGEHPPFGPADAAIVDAPCTGTATLARHPDARWRLDADDPETLAAVQARILDGAAALVRPGGRLTYATCTLEPEENEGVVEAFLARRADFSMDGERAILQVFPGEISTDGAFAARLRRIA